MITLSSCNNSEKINYNLIAGKYSSGLVSQVNDMTQKGNIIYIANKTQLVSYNVSEGTEAVFNITFSDLSFIDSDDTYIYAYDKTKNCLYIIDDSGNVTDSIIISGMKDAVKIYDFAVTGDYFIFYADINKQNSFFIIHRIDGQTEMVKSNRSVSSVISYKNNSVIIYISEKNSNDSYFTVYNIDDDSFGDKFKSNVVSISAAAYNEYTDSIIFSSFNTLTQICDVKTLSFGDGLIKTIMYYPADMKIDAISSDANIISWYISGNYFNLYDIAEKRDEITIATYGYIPESLQYIISRYSQNNGVIISQTEFPDKDKMNVKLLAGDKDFDIYILSSLFTQVDYIKAGAYTDLSGYASIKDNLKKHRDLFEVAATVDNKIFGIPINLYPIDTSLYHINEEAHMICNNIYQYMFENINLYNYEFKDTSGEKLAELYTYMMSRNIDSDDYSVPMNGDYIYVTCDYAIINPASENKEAAVDFLNNVISTLSGETDISDASESMKTSVIYYPEGVNYNGVYANWKAYDVDIFLCIQDGFKEIINGNMTPADAAAAASKKISLIINE